METTRMIARLSLFVLGLFCLCATGCKRSQKQAKAPTLAASELNLPGLSPDQKKEAYRSLQWNSKTLVGDYDRIGSRNAKWDASAHRVLELFGQVRAYGQDVEGFPLTLRYEVERAVENGCDDPLVRYLYTRFRSDASSLSTAQMLQDYSTAADRLLNSGYANIRKFYGALRASQAYFANRKNNPANQQSAARYLNVATEQLFLFLQAPDLPVAEVDEACSEFLLAIRYWNTEKDVYDRLETILLQKWPKAGFTYFLRGRFYMDYAWEGRSSKFAAEVTPEQWKLFRDRLATAYSILNEGYATAPHEGRIPAVMINVVAGQEKGFPEMQRWFERAMEADTNNYMACEHMLNFLLPRWGGSREAMVEFGRRCLNSDKWGGTVPLALVGAHYTYNRYDGAPDGSYWLQPDVWPDIKAAYEKFFARNPNAKHWRSYYARYAFWCGQADALREQLDLAGDNLDEEAFGSTEYYYRALAMAKKDSAKAGGAQAKSTGQ